MISPRFRVYTMSPSEWPIPAQEDGERIRESTRHGKAAEGEGRFGEPPHLARDRDAKTEDGTEKNPARCPDGTMGYVGTMRGRYANLVAETSGCLI